MDRRDFLKLMMSSGAVIGANGILSCNRHNIRNTKTEMIQMSSRLDKYTPLINSALDQAKTNGVYAIVRMQDESSTHASILNRQTQSKAESTTRGMGISVFTKKGASGFSSVQMMDEGAIRNAVDLASNLAKGIESYGRAKKNTDIFHVPRLNVKLMQSTPQPIDSLNSKDLEALVLSINSKTKDMQEEMEVNTFLKCTNEQWRIARSDGTDVTYNMPKSVMGTIMTLKQMIGGEEKISEMYFTRQGRDLGLITTASEVNAFLEETADKVQFLNDLLKAGIIKGGNYKSILSAGFVGLYAHEAVGHPFETDDLRTSIVAKDGRLMLGKKVAPDNVSFIDMPFEGKYGNQFISSNGIIRKKVEFIKNGVIVDGISDVFSANDAGVGINGCGRAQTYQYLPLCRMSATMMVDSNPIEYDKSFEETTPDDIYDVIVANDLLKPGEKAVMPVGGMGGQVNPVEGTFVFNCRGIYLFENPKKIKLYKQSIFSGNTLGTIATPAKGIGKIVIDDPGMCGKGGQGAPVSDGGNMFTVLDATDYITFGGEQ